MEIIALQYRGLFQVLFQNQIQIDRPMNFTQKEYLMSLGEDVLSNPTKLEKAKSDYKKMYMQHYKREYNQKNKRLKLTFTNKEYDEILLAAEDCKKPVARYVKECFYAYIHSEYLVPDDTQIEKLGGLLRQIGNNVNQIARWANENRYVQSESVQYLYQQLKMIKTRMEEIFKRPDNLLDVVEKAVQENPFLKEELLKLLNDKPNKEN